MSILLTEAEGNLGTEIRRQARAPVVGLGREGWQDLDTALAGVDTVLHAASDLRTRAVVAPAALMNSNIMSTALLLEAAKRHGVRRFVFMSSCAVYGEDMRTPKESPCAPITINGICKLLNEKLVAEFCTAASIKYQILRIFNTYGGNDRFSILSRLEQAILRGKPFTLNNMGRMQRDFIHVSDVAAVVWTLLQYLVKYSHLNIGTGVATKISTIVELVAQQFPHLVLGPGTTTEAEYSRADIGKLNRFWSRDFIPIDAYVKQRFRSDVLGTHNTVPLH